MSGRRLHFSHSLTRAQSYVYVFFLLPRGTDPKLPSARLSPTSVEVTLGEETLLKGELFAAIKAEESVWFAGAHRWRSIDQIDSSHITCPVDGMLQLVLLKRNRRGFYAQGCCNSDTFWWSLLAGRGAGERLPGENVPPEYYKTEWEPVGVLEGGMRRGGRPAARKVLTAA